MTQDLAFLQGGGEMGAFMRAHDWSGSSLGSPEAWPQPLKTLVDVMLAANQPMFVAWGPERTLLYNDAYAEILASKHPALDRDFLEVWREIRADLLPIVEQAYAGRPVHMDDIELVMERRGYPEETHFAFSYTPVRDEAGAVSGFFCPCVEITEEVFAKRHGVAERERLARMFDQAPGFMAMLRGPEHVFELANTAYMRLVGHRDVLGRPVRDALPEIEGQGFFELLDDVYARGEPFVGRSMPVDVQRAPGAPVERRFLDLVYQPIIDADGRVTGVFVEGSDVTERVVGETELRESEARLRALTDNLPSGMVYQIATGRDGTERRFLYVSQSHEKLTGVSAEAVLADPSIPYGLILPEDREAMREAEEDSLRLRKPFDVQVRFRHVGGEVRWCRIVSAPREQPDGSLIWDGVQIDVTDQKRAEESLRASEAKFEAIANSIDQMVWSTRPDGHHDYYNQRWYDYTGVPEGSTDGEAWNEVFHPDDRETAWAAWRRSLETGEPYRIEYRLRHRSGRYRWVLGRAQAVRDEAGCIARWYGTCTDIQEIVEAREVLDRSREELERRVDERTAERDRVWRLSQDLLAIVETDGIIRSANAAWAALLGWAPAEVMGKTFMELTHPDDLERTLEVFFSVFGTPLTVPYEFRLRHKDGTYRWFGWTAAFESGAVYATGRDVTDRKEQAAALAQAEDALRQSQKMEAVGQLTGGLAHDFNNILAGISGSLDMMATRTAQGRVADVERYMLAAQGATKRAAALTHRLLAFSRRQTLDPKPTDVNRLTAGMEELIRRTVGPAVEVETVAKGGLWTTLVDPHQLENALLNLCINARDAMPEGGKIIIETANSWLDDRAARERDLPPGQYVSLCVSDDGVGMSPEVLEKAFDPFFTTKPIGQGTGLGLSMVYGFARQSGGQVRIYSEVGRGANVCLYLPRHHGAEAAEPSEPVEKAESARASETVLVIDDEPLVRMLVVDLLEDLGYTALEADDGPQGLKVIRSGARIDLLITDVGLPSGMNGRQVADAAREVRPDLKVLFITGYAENAVLSHGHLEPGMQVATKPFDMARLASRIREMIGKG